MPPKLLPKPSLAGGTQSNNTNQGRGYGAYSTEAGTVPQRAASDVQKFEFVNVTGSKKPGASSQTLIRSHVMREVRRGENLRKSQTESEKVEAIRDSTTSKDVRMMQVQRLRMGSAGLQPMQPTKRSKKSRSNKNVLQTLSQTLSAPSLEGVAVDQQNAIFLTSENMPAGQLLPAVPLTGFNPSLVLHHSIRSRAIAAGFGWQESLPLFGRGNLGPETGPEFGSTSGYSGKNRRTYDNGELEAEIQRKDWPQGSLKISPENFGAKRLDVFNTMPIQRTRRTELLVHHFHHRINVSSLMMNARKCWFVLATKDQAFLIIALSHAAGHLSLLEKRGDPNEALNLRNDAIRIVNSRLSQAQYGISEETFGAVASMASYEATNGSLSSTQTHMNGLEQMVNTRGSGLQDEFSPHMRRLIAWADINAAVALSTSPRFLSIEDLIPEASLTFHPLQSKSHNTLRSLQRHQGIDGYRNLDHGLLSSIVDIHDLTQFLGIQDYEPGSNMDHYWFSDMVYSIQRRLVSVLCKNQAHHSRMEKSCSLAALIYVKCVLRCVSPNANIVGMLASRLCSSMKELFHGPVTYDEVDGRSKLCLWILFVGGAAALDENEHSWFVTQLTFLCDFLELREWRDAKAGLQDLSWPEMEVALVGRYVWEEIQETRAVNQGFSRVILEET